MYYRSFNDLNDAVVGWLPRLPARLDLVVGIPRSGLLVANLIALYRGLPMTDVEGLIAGRLLTAPGEAPPDLFGDGRALDVLVVDDSVYSGKELTRTRARLRAAGLPHRLLFGAAYVRPARRGAVDSWAEVVPHPRAFEWNLMHHPYLELSCLEVDGVLCAPPPPGADPGDPAVLAGLSPLLRPTTKLGWLVTARPERLRRTTEAWLDRHGIAARGLCMAPEGEEPERTAARKAEAYRSSRAWLFLEDGAGMASAIASRTGRPVFCAADRTMVYPGGQARPSPRDRLESLAWSMRFGVERRLQRRAMPALGRPPGPLARRATAPLGAEARP